LPPPRFEKPRAARLWLWPIESGVAMRRPWVRFWNIQYNTPCNFRCAKNMSHRAMLRCRRNRRGIPFGEIIAIQIFSFSLRNLPLIDAVILTGIPSRQIR
jgi:hypothetical protein